MTSSDNLKVLMIPEPAIAIEGFGKDLLKELVPEFIAGAVLLGPFAIGAGINAIKRAMARKANAGSTGNHISGSSRPVKKHEDQTPHIQALTEEHPAEVKAEIENRIKFLKQLDQIIVKVARKHDKVSGFGFTGGREAIKWLLAHYQDAEYDSFDSPNRQFLTDILPEIHPADGSKVYNDWTYDCGYVIPLFSYDIWTWVEDHPECSNARDFEQTKEYWDEQNAIIADFASLLKNNDFFYSIECGGDWDDGTMDICCKPSDKILSLAAKTSKYRAWPKAPNK